MQRYVNLEVCDYVEDIHKRTFSQILLDYGLSSPMKVMIEGGRRGYVRTGSFDSYEPVDSHNC